MELCQRFYSDEYGIYNYLIVYKYLCIKEKTDVLQDLELNICFDKSKAPSLLSMKRCLEAYEKKQIGLANEYTRLVGGRFELS